MKARLNNGAIDIIPTNNREREYLQSIIGMRFDPISDISAEENGNTLTYFRKLRLFCQINNNGTEFADVSIET